MSLLQNEDFVIYQLRSSYLSSIKDGVGERLINLNSSVLNNPSFRAAGWQPSEVRRTYSPPIPAVITSEYFQAPRFTNSLGAGTVDYDDLNGVLAGGVGSGDTVGPTLQKRRRRKEPHHPEQEDSSDPSDESDDDPESRSTHIMFAKVPLRSRAGSSPIRNSNLKDGPAVFITSPSKPSEGSNLRRGSLGSLDATRPRRDTTTTTTTTSSELSSENEIDSAFFQRKPVNSRAARASRFLTERIQEDDREYTDHIEGDDAADGSDSSLLSEFVGSADSTSILGDENPLGSLAAKSPALPTISTSQKSSPRKPRSAAPSLQPFPGPRPISIVAPVSLLTQALKSKDQAVEDPFLDFTNLQGKWDPNPLYIKIYVPSSSNPDKPFELLLCRKVKDVSVTVAEAIGLALWQYGEEAIKPEIPTSKAGVNYWNFRMVEDGEVDFDFPALGRTMPISDFTSNNNRGGRMRSRQKPWDEFALVEASESEVKENERATPKYSIEKKKSTDKPQNTATASQTPSVSFSLPISVPTPGATATPSFVPFRNPITGPAFSSSAFRKESITPLDAPATTSHATPRTGPPKTLNIHFTDDNFLCRTTLVEVTTDTYIAEVFDQVCKRLNVDKGLYVLKVSNTTTVAPSDRTVEALGERADLDLVRRRFIGDGAIGLSGSPGSSSPNAPLLISNVGTPKRGKAKHTGMSAGIGASSLRNADVLGMPAASGSVGGGGAFKRYYVTRKQPMSFSASSARVLMLDAEFMHIMPSEGPRALWETSGKTTTVPFSSVVGCTVSRKHPRMFRVVVFRERESKRYDFEASSKDEAAAVVADIKRGMEMVKPERGVDGAFYS